MLKTEFIKDMQEMFCVISEEIQKNHFLKSQAELNGLSAYQSAKKIVIKILFKGFLNEMTSNMRTEVNPLFLFSETIYVTLKDNGCLAKLSKYVFSVENKQALNEAVITPDMLTVFENLIDGRERKIKGVFYTPLKIVQYMCRESLVYYLANNSGMFHGDLRLFLSYQEGAKARDSLSLCIQENLVQLEKLLADVKVLEPCVGAGVFALCMLDEIVNARHIISVLMKKNTRRYQLRREAIENSLYFADIDGNALDITKFRLWLSLEVEDGLEEQKNSIKYNFLLGNSLLEDFYKRFPEVFRGNGGFDIVIGNPPYGANIDNLVDIYKEIFPEVIKNYADIYKIYFEQGMRLCGTKGLVAYITPNTFLSQPRYKDLRKFLLAKNIIQIVNLGLEVFPHVAVPVCIAMIADDAPGISFKFADLSTESKFNGDLIDIEYTEVSREHVLRFSDLSLLQGISLKEGELYFDDVFELRDAGIQYHRSGIGLKNKGGNDLYERIFSNNPGSFKKAQPVWYGKIIDCFYINPNTNEFFNLNYAEVLNKNETVSFSKQAFQMQEKIIWRQTANCLIAALDEKGRWFRNTIQCCWIKDEHKDKLDIKYALGIFNSSYFKYLYNKIVNEAGRVYPQVKLTHVKKLPIKLVSFVEQQEIISLVDNILLITSSDEYATNVEMKKHVGELQKELDDVVYRLYT